MMLAIIGILFLIEAILFLVIGEYFFVLLLTDFALFCFILEVLEDRE